MKLDSKSGATLAIAAATLFLAGATVSTTSYAAGEGQCVGANACKGPSACKGGNHACKRLNACKGQGFAEMTQRDCTNFQAEDGIRDRGLGSRQEGVDPLRMLPPWRTRRRRPSIQKSRRWAL